MKITLTQADALVIIDMQNDFLPGGSLSVPLSDVIIPAINRYLSLFQRLGFSPIYHTGLASCGSKVRSKC